MSEAAKPSHSMASQATLHQMMAFLLVYSRLPPLVLVPPLAIMAMPIMFFILNYFTDGHGHCAVLGIIVLWHSLAVLIKKLSRSPEKAEESLARNEFRLPFLSLFITLVFLKSITRFTGDALVYFPSTNTFTWGFVRLAIVTFLLEVATCLRYFSPPSIMRCSSVPLISNPFESSVRFLIEHPNSIFEPSDTPGSWSSSFAPRYDYFPGRRYQHPPAASSFIQTILLALFGSMCFAFVCRPWIDDDIAGSTASVLVFLFPMALYVRQTNHELDPRLYLNFSSKWLVTTMTQSALKSVLMSIVVLCTSLTLHWVFSDKTMLNLALGLQLAIFSFFCLSMQLVWEEFLRVSLFSPRRDITQQLLEMADSSDRDCVRLMLQSIFSNSSFVDSICKGPSVYQSRISIDEMEMRQLPGFCEAWSRQLVQRDSLYVEAPLEEDLLRFAILEALGGPDTDSRQRHVRIVGYWRQAVGTLSHGGTVMEPPAATLVRGLSVAIGGMGEALLGIGLRAGMAHMKRRLDTWILSVGGLVELEYCLVALTRLLMPCDHPRTAQHLEALIPAALTSLYKLFCGLKKFEDTQIVADPTSFRSVVRASEKAASEIGRSFDVQAASLNMSRDVINWVANTRSLRESTDGSDGGRF